MSYALEHNRKKVFEELDRNFPPGKKMKPADVFQMWFPTFLSNNSIYKKFSAEDAKSVAEIAALVGYDNQSKFSGTFKKKYGMTPLEYRRSIS